MSSFWVYARGVWRRLELPSGRVRGWAGRAHFCFVRRGRLVLARDRAVLRGLQALQAGQASSVRDGLPLSQRRRARAARPASPRCCCRRVAADARNALVQLNLTALQPNLTALQPNTAGVQPAKTDAAVQADEQPQTGVQLKAGGQTQTGGQRQAGRKRSRSVSPGPLPAAKLRRPAAHSDDASEAAPPCKELIVNEEDVVALRRFLERDESGLFAVDLHRFDADDEYKSALFYRINPLVCAERDARIADMLHQQRDEQSLLRAFAGSLGLRAVGELRARQRYRMRPRAGSDKENAAGDALPNKLRERPWESAYKSRDPPWQSVNKSRERPWQSANKSRDPPWQSANKSRDPSADSATDSDSSGSSDSDSDFQSHSRVLRNKKRSYERNTRSKLAQIRSKYEKTKEQRDDDVRSKYLVKPRNVREKDEKSVSSDDISNDDRSKRSAKSKPSNDKPKDRVLPKDKERSDAQAEMHHQPRERLRNGTACKDSEDISIERSRLNDKDQRRSLRSRADSTSPSIISKKLKTQPAKESSGDSTDARDRIGKLRDRRARLFGKKVKDPKDWSSNTVDSKDRKRNDTRSKDRDLPLSVDRSKDRDNGESSKDISSSNRSKDAVSSPSKNKMKRKVNELDNSDASENAWVERNGEAKDRSEGVSQARNEHSTGAEGEKRPRRSTANTSSVFPEQRREYSSLEDHVIVQWVSLGARARRVNGNAVWRELQEQFSRLAGRSRSWHSLRNRYLRSILPALGQLALPPARVAALRAAQAQGEIKSRRRAPAPNPLLSLPAVRSAWGARPRARRQRSHDSHDSHVPATSESEPTQRTLRSSPRKRTPRAPPPPTKRPPASPASPGKRQPSPTYSEVTRRFGASHAASTPELRPRDAAPRDTSPHKKTRKLFNPKKAM